MGEEMKQAISIRLERAEGRVRECESVVFVRPSMWQDANLRLFQWSMTAPRDGGYHKCDFRVTFEDGETYEGRYDLVHHTVDRPNLERHMRNHVDFSTGDWTPPHMTKARHGAYLQDVVGSEKVEAYRKFRAEYQIGGCP
jgi:hypothetical protein